MVRSIAYTEGEIQSISNLLNCIASIPVNVQETILDYKSLLLKINKKIGGPGKFRAVRVTARGHKTEYAEAWKINILLDNLFTKLHNNEINEAQLLISLLKIHPFQDYNGRTSKLFMYYVYKKYYIWKNQELFISMILSSDYENMLKYLLENSFSM